MEIKELNQKVAEYSINLQANDARFSNNVAVTHSDGSFFFLNNAFVMYAGVEYVDDDNYPPDDQWFLFFTEHHGVYVFHHTDVISMSYTQKEIGCFKV